MLSSQMDGGDEKFEKKIVCHVKITSPRAADEVEFLFLFKSVQFNTENIVFFF